MQNMQILRSPGNTIIRVNDSENAQKLSKSHLQFDTVLDSDNFCNCVDISKLSKEHDYAKARPAISAYTGTDYLSALYRKGNLRPLLSMKKKKQSFGDAFVALNNFDLSDIIIADIMEFICHMYDCPKSKCLDDVKIQVKQRSSCYGKSIYILQRFEGSCTHFQADQLLL